MPKFLKRLEAKRSIRLAERLADTGKDNKLVGRASKMLLKVKGLPKGMLTEQFNKQLLKRGFRFNVLFQNIENDSLTNDDCKLLKKRIKLLIKGGFVIEDYEGEFNEFFSALKKNVFSFKQKVFLKQIIPIIKETISSEIGRETKRFNISKEKIIGGVEI